MTDALRICPVGPDELPVLRDLAEATFLNTFSSQNAPQNISAYASVAFDMDRVRAEYENAHSRFYFARTGSDIAGYLKLNTGPAQTEQDLENAMEIERIYATRAFQGQGIGKCLMATALELAREAGVDWVWLGVWEHNQKAITFYEHQGFEPFGRHSFRMGSDVQIDVMMKKKIARD
jgi:diamine N-acetyltransferase